MRRWFRRLLYVMGVLIALAALAVGVMSTPWFQRALQRHVIASLENATGGHVDVANFRFSPALLQATLQGLVLHGAERKGESPLFSARTLVVGLDPSSLVRRKLLLRSLGCDQAQIHLYSHADGSTNLPGWQTPWQLGPLTEAVTNLSIGRLTVTRTQVFWNEDRLLLNLNARDVAILLRRDPSQRYSGSLSSSAVTIRASGRSLPPLRVAAHFGLSADSLEVTLLPWQCAGLHGKGTFSLSHWASPKGELSFQVGGEIAELARTLHLKEVRSGKIHWDGRATYHSGEFTAEGSIQARQFLVRSLPLEVGGVDVSTDYSADRRHVEFSNLIAYALGGTAQGRGEISLQGSAPRFVLRTKLRDLPADRLLHLFPTLPVTLTRFHLASRIAGTLDAAWNGPFDDFNCQFNLQLHPQSSGPPDTRPLSGFVQGSASLARGLVLQIQDARFETPQSTLTARGTLGVQQVSLALKFAAADFEEWRPTFEFLAGATEPVPLKLKSKAIFTGEASGSISQPNVRGRLELGPFDYHDWTWNSLTADVLLTPDLIEVSSGRLRGGESAVTFAGEVTLANWKVAEHGSIRLKTRLERTPLAGLIAALGLPAAIRGVATGRLEVAGTPLNLSGAGEFRVDHGAWAEEPFGALSAGVRIAESVWYFDDVRLTKGEGRLKAQARVRPSQRAFWVELHGADFALADFARLAPLQEAKRGGTADARLGFDLRAQGTPEDVTLTATYGIRNATVNGEPVGDLRGQADWKGAQMRMEGKFQGPAGTLQFAGVARAEDDWPLELSGQYANLRADPWIRWLLERNFNPEVTASGTFRLAGPLRKPSQLELRGQAQSLEVSFPNLTWKNDQPVDFHYANRTLAARRFRIKGPSTDLEVEGEVHFSQPAALSLTAQGKADAALLRLIDPALQASGQSEVNLRASGNLGHPLTSGTLRIQDASLGYGDLPFRLTGLKGEIALEGDRATVRSLRGMSGGGSITLGGFLTLADSPRFNLQAELSQVQVQHPTEFTSVLDGSLRLTGTAQRGQLSGGLTVRQIHTSENFNWLARVGEAGNPIGRKPPAIPSPLASNLRLNIEVGSAVPVRLKTRDLRLVGDLDLRIQGTLANPVEVGTIHILSGEAIFRGNRYKLNRGDISMTNPFRTQLVADLEAQTRVQRYDLTVDLSGPLDRMKISYRSDPPLPTVDIISLLAFGYARQQEEMATTARQPVPTVGASALLSEALSTQLSGRIQRLFGVSRIRIDPNVGGLGSTGGARVTVEQQVTRDFTLTYVTTTASSQQRIIQFEWAVSDKISLVGARDQNGIFGMELKFRQRFK